MNIEKWMEENFKRKVNSKTYKEVLYFSIIWNIFEKEITENNFNVPIALQILKEKIDKVLVENYFEHIKEYISNKYDREYAYYAFYFRRNDIDMEKFLKLYNTELYEEKLEFLLWISYRVRNNMFHGIKEINGLNSQFKLFYYLNRFLIICIEINRKSKFN